jgi:hypothetical protein
MRRTRTWLCLVILLAVGALSASTASAAEYEMEGLPEFGRCVPATTAHTGEYKGNKCLTPMPGTGNYNWEPGPGPKPKFEGLASNVTFETVGKKFKVQCGFADIRGEYKTPKTASVKLEMVGCVRPDTLQKCQTNPGKEGEIEATFEGELGFISAKPKVGLKLTAPTPIPFSCGLPPEVPIPVSIEGSAIGLVKTIDNMSEVIKYSYVAPGGKQNPESFEGEPKATLTETWVNGVEVNHEQTGLTIIGIEEKPKALIVENEEPIEVKAK